MITYYVKKGEVYKVSATVKCDIYDGNGEIFNSCEAGSFVSFNAPTAKIVLSDGDAVLTCLSEVSGDLSGLSEHVNNSSIHTTPTDKSRWNGISGDLSDIEREIPELEAAVQELNNSVDAHIESDSIHVTSAERQNWNAAHTHSDTSDVHITSADRQNWNGKANGTHSHEISDIANLQNTLDGKASTSDIAALDVGVKRIDYGCGNGEGVRVYTQSSGQLSNTSGYSDYKEYTATKDVCLIYNVSNAPNEGYTSDFDNISYNFPVKIWMNVKVNGSYRLSYPTYRRICTGGLDFIEAHLKAGDEVQFCAASVSKFSGCVSIRLMEFNYR